MRNTSHSRYSFSRRSALLAGAAVAAGTLLPRQNAAAADLDLDDPWQRLTALAKLRGSLDGRMVMWWMKGMYYGVVDDIATPLFSTLIGSFLRLKPLPGKGYELTMLELAYFTDLKTGAVLDTFTNPYNGKLCTVPEQRLGPYPVLMTPTGVVLPQVPAFGNVELTTRLGPAIVQGDDVWIRDDSTVKVDSDHPMLGKHVYNELATYQGRLSELNNPDLSSAAATIDLQGITSWREWMQADGIGGHAASRAAGAKIYRVEDFPAEYLAAARARHGAIIADPQAALDTPPPPPPAAAKPE